MTSALTPDQAAWLKRRTYTRPRSLGEVLAAKAVAGAGVTVCLPALNEAATIGAICREVISLRDSGVVDQLVVLDSGSEDGTDRIALEAGAEVHRAADLVPDVPRSDAAGKGDTLWRSLAVARGDLVVWADADVSNFSARFVLDLVAPLLTDPELVMTKAFYERPLDGKTGEGARVTEIVVRPLLQMFTPELSAVIQPLAGEFALRRSAALRLPFFTGYAVDVGLLLDTVSVHGLDAVAQVDLGVRVHRNQPTAALGRMSFQIMQALFARFDELGRLKLGDELPSTLVRFDTERPGEVRTTAAHLRVVELPPIASVLPGLVSG